MGLDKDLFDDSGTVSTDEAGQSKSLIANVYSSDGTDDPDSYKELDDWDVSEEDIALAHDVTAGSGASSLVRDALKKASASGSHEEWYTVMQIALAHRVAQRYGRDQLPDGREVRGAVPLMEHVSIEGSDIMDYLRAHPEYIGELDTEELAELRDEREAEPAEADD